MLCKKLLLLKPSHIHNHLKREDKEKFRCKYKIKELIETEKDLDFLLEPLEKTIKSIENLNKVILKDKLYLKKNELVKSEWRDAARRIDHVLLVFSGIVVLLVPFFLFSKYFYENSFKSLNKLSSCGCNV